jgi:hypothetical protein
MRPPRLLSDGSRELLAPIFTLGQDGRLFPRRTFGQPAREFGVGHCGQEWFGPFSHRRNLLRGSVLDVDVGSGGLCRFRSFGNTPNWQAKDLPECVIDDVGLAASRDERSLANLFSNVGIEHHRRLFPPFECRHVYLCSICLAILTFGRSNTITMDRHCQ